jgi:LexA DNA binding domain
LNDFGRFDRSIASALTAKHPFSSLSEMQGLTDRQAQVLSYIRSSILDRGYPPTLREIGAHMGIRSTNGVNDHLRALERKGYLTREDMKSRALRPMENGRPMEMGRMQEVGDLDDAAANTVSRESNPDILEVSPSWPTRRWPTPAWSTRCRSTAR